MPKKFEHYLSICAIAKNEGFYLLEWIEYHLMAGVGHFYIYDNASSDHTRDILRHYVDKGIVEYVFWPEHPGQLTAYSDCVAKHKNDSRWIGFIDLDEFIIPLETATIPEFLKAYEGMNGLGINMIAYGTSGHDTRPEGLQIEKYTYHSREDFSSNLHIKTIADPRRIKVIHSMHSFLFEDSTSVRDENLEDIGVSPRTKRNSSNKIRINHYFTRSGEDIFAKLKRGRASLKARRCAKYFYDHDRNEIEDPVMEKHVPELKQRVARAEDRIMRSDPGVKFLSGRDTDLFSSNIWNFIKFVIEYISHLKAGSILEVGKYKVFNESDFVSAEQMASHGSSAFYKFDIKDVPWPIADKKYDLVVALDVFESIRAKERGVLLEMGRISKMAMISFFKNTGISEGNIQEWTLGLNPFKKIDTANRVLYLFKFQESDA